MDDLTEAQQQEYRDAHSNFATDTGGGTPGTDARGRRMVETMTDRELLKEAVTRLREFDDALTELGNNPMLKALPGFKMFGK